MDFEVIQVLWRSKIAKFDDYGEALEYAKTMTFEEDEDYNDAFIISAKKDGTAILEGVHWVMGGAYLVEKLTF